MAWQIRFTETAEKQLAKLDSQIKKRIIEYLNIKIAQSENPMGFGDSLKENLTGLWKYRVGSYRIICEIQEEQIVILILRIGHRSKIYGGH